MDRLKDKVALVTGSARGIGARIVELMVSEGATVIGADLQVDGNAEVRLDVASEADWVAVALKIEREHGRLDILVNNAGIENAKPLPELTLADWRRVMAVNVEGVFLGCRTMLPLLETASERGEHASIINMSSVAANIGLPLQACYSASKAAVAAFTRTIAIEFATAGTKVRANTVHPTAINTPLFRQTIGEMVVLPGSEEEKIAVVAGANPMGRIGDVDDVAWACVYLASSEAKFVNGLELRVDGGLVAQ